MTTLSKTNPITRRTAIGGGIVYGMACLSSRRMLAATMLPIVSAGDNRQDAGLYAFPGSSCNTTVIALIAREHSSPSQIRIHAGPRDWVFQTAGVPSHNFPIFMGKITGGSAGSARTRDALVIEAPNAMLAGVERSGIWAEQFAHSGTRERIGSPFLTALIANNARLAREYHASRPSVDREALLEAVADEIAAQAWSTPQIVDPLAYGRRLASRLLPDVLHYNPELPQGFSFAARNGRHPGEDANAVVSTTLNGAPVSYATAPSWRLGNAFAYFPRPIALA